MNISTETMQVIYAFKAARRIFIVSALSLIGYDTIMGNDLSAASACNLALWTRSSSFLSVLVPISLLLKTEYINRINTY